MRRALVRDLVAHGILRVEDGNHGNDRPRPNEFVSDGVPFIRAADMTGGVVDFDNAGRINATARRRVRKGVGSPGDVILSHKGTVGRIAVAPDDSPDFVCSPQTTFWRSLDPTVVDQRFLKFVLLSADFVRQLDMLKSQTDMAPYVSLTDQRSIELRLPGIEQQRAIATVLGALDEKIAANARLADVAGELARAMFSQAIADTPMSDSTFEQVCEVGGGGTPKTGESSFWGGGVPWATPTDVTALSGPYLGSTARTITLEGLDACSSPLYPAGSILMTSRATIGAFAIASVPMAVNQGFIVVNPRDARLRYWFFHEMRDRVDEFISHANGATFLELSRGNFKRLPLRLASESVMTNFCERAEALHASAAAALVESRLLARTRDELLPLLMSGQLRVKDAEAVAESVR